MVSGPCPSEASPIEAFWPQFAFFSFHFSILNAFLTPLAGRCLPG
jgi:hypothetical protein